LKRCADLAQQQKRLLEEIDALERQLAAKQSALKVNSQIDLPDAMGVAGLHEFTIVGGHKVKLETSVRASIPIAFLQEGIEYMMEAAPNLVKHTVNIEFGMGDAAIFHEFMADLKAREVQVNATIKDTVHPGTLAKFVRECDEQDKSLPEDILGVYRQKFAKLHLPKMGKEDI